MRAGASRAVDRDRLGYNRPFPYLGGICPTRFRCNGHPGTDRTLGMRVTRPKFPQRPAGDHLHVEIISCHHLGDNRIRGQSSAEVPGSCPRGVVQDRKPSQICRGRDQDAGAAAVVPVVCGSDATGQQAGGSRSNVIMSAIADSGHESRHDKIDETLTRSGRLFEFSAAAEVAPTLCLP